MKENNDLVIKSMIYSFDNCFKTVNDIIYTISILPYEMYDPNGHRNLSTYNTYKLEKQIAEVIYPYDYIDELVIFFNYSDLVITSKGTMSFDSLFENRYRSSEYAPEFWRNFAVTRHSLKYIPSSWYSDATYNATLSSNNSLNKSKLLGVIGSNQVASSDMNILVFINEEKLLKHILQKGIMTGTLIVLDQDKNVVFSVGDESNLRNIESVYFNDMEEGVQKGSYNYYSIVSDYNNFVYVNRIPNEFTNLFPVVKTNQITLMCALLTGIMASGLLSFIIFNTYKKRNKDLESNLSFYKSDVINSLLHKMSAFHCGEDKTRVYSYFKEVFKEQSYFLISFVVNPTEIISHNRSKQGAEENKPGNLIEGFESVKNIINEYLQSEFSPNILEHTSKNEYLAMIGVDPGVNRNEILGKVSSIHKGMLKDLQGKYNIVIAVSNIYSQIEEFKKAQMDLLLCMDYRRVNDVSVVLDSQKIEYVSNVFLPMSEIDKLTGYVISGNFEESEEIIKNIITQNIERNVSRYKLMNILTAMFITIVEALMLYKYNVSDIEELEKRYFNIIKNHTNFREIQAFLIETVSKIVEKIQLESQSKLNKEFIIQYINLHYNENLYLDNMAELLGTSPKYFSNLFKKLTGTNFVEYLNKTRISHAREYLKTTAIPISEVGERVGFINPSTFTSTFRKYSGISPNEYRKKFKE